MYEYPETFDVLVLGAGHAGVEAGLAAARLGAHTGILTQNLDTIGQMSCNPAIGGLAKGHMVREIDALGGVMGQNTDATGIQFRMLNARKGPSVQAPRAQCDKKAYQFRLKWVLEHSPRLHLLQGNAVQIVVENDRVVGVETNLGLRYRARSVVVTTWTFMRGLMHVGLQSAVGGRMGDAVSTLSDSLHDLGLAVERFKTGTPCRLLGRSIDFAKCQRQDGDSPAPMFSFAPEEWAGGEGGPFTLNRWDGDSFHVEQMPCWITYTNAQTHDLIRANLDKSPIYAGIIEGVGPRYCPSIEDRWCALPTKSGIRFFSSQRDARPGSITSMGCRPVCPSRCNWLLSVRCPAWKRRTFCGPGMRWSMIIVRQRNCIRRLRQSWLRVCILRGKSMGRPGMRRRQRRAWSRGPMRRSNWTPSPRSTWNVRRATWGC